MIAIARGIRRFDGRAAFTTWCYRVATNAALDELRRKRRRPVPSTPTRPEPVAAGSVDRRPRSTPGSTSTPRSRELPEEFRVAVVLRDLCDLDYAEIAEVLDVPPGTVRSRISRSGALPTPRGTADRRARTTPGNPPPRTSERRWLTTTRATSALARAGSRSSRSTTSRAAAWSSHRACASRRGTARPRRRACGRGRGRRGRRRARRRGWRAGHRSGGGDDARGRRRRPARRRAASPGAPALAPEAALAAARTRSLGRLRRPRPAPPTAAALRTALEAPPTGVGDERARRRRGRTSTPSGAVVVRRAPRCAPTSSRRAPIVAVGQRHPRRTRRRRGRPRDRGDGTQSIDAVLTGPCEVRPLS